MLTKLSRETLADQAARNLMAFIQAQALKPGSFLPPETQLAADLGVSRPIIREALKSLEGKGIIEVMSGKGAVIKPLDGQQLELYFQRAIEIESEAIIDLLELRKGIEVQSAVLAAQRCTPGEILSLAQIVAEMRRNLHNPNAYVELDIAFHIQIAAMTRNTMIRTLVGALRAAINSTINESMFRKQTNQQLEHVQVGHEAILACLERGDAEESGRAMTAHFTDAVNSLVYGLRDGVQHPQTPEAAPLIHEPPRV
jgi:GntR family transcriptional regulator, transcriptional repressor for pyruvate dehydrogenase complex